MLPCKHFVAVMRDIKDWSWSKFPESYRCSPYLTLDEIVNPKPPEEHEGTTSKADGVTENTEGTVQGWKKYRNQFPEFFCVESFAENFPENISTF